MIISRLDTDGCVEDCLTTVAACSLCANNIFVCTTGSCSSFDKACVECVGEAALKCVGCADFAVKCAKQCIDTAEKPEAKKSISKQ